MSKTTLLKEVEYIDGVQEFLEEGYVTELLGKSESSFELSGVPVDGTIRFSGDTSLFNKQVYSLDDLSISGAWHVNGKTLKIKPELKTSEYTYTYITYKKKALTKKEGLFSVDYDKGYLYTSTPIKNVKIQYKYAIQYVQGQKMTQVPATEYTRDSIYSIPTDERTKLSYLYQIQNTVSDNNSKEYYTDGKISMVTLGDKDE